MTDKQRVVVEAARVNLTKALILSGTLFAERVAHEIEEMINAKFMEFVAALDADKPEAEAVCSGCGDWDCPDCNGTGKEPAR